jgi:UDP-N-acetylmuramoyl-L-alanyl-D-glutamate--2,6-diaminopimelate ligase
VEKRREQGEIADEYSDIIILTDEDPRGEDSISIIREIAEGIQHKSLETTLFFIPDREKAIAKALKFAHDNDLVLCLGKSHEESIIYADGPKPWDEIGTVTEILNSMGFDKKK